MPDKKEPISDEELVELVLEAQQEALEKERLERIARLEGKDVPPKKKRRSLRLFAWIMVIMLAFSTFGVIFEIYSIPAIEFLKTSARLSSQNDIKEYKNSVVEISTTDSKGTGFTISEDGYIVTNHHVIEDALTLTVVFPDDGMYRAEVVESYEDIDLALLKVDGDDLPHLTLNENYNLVENEPVYFIGNPLYFTGIANEGTVLDSTILRNWEEYVYMMDAPVYRGNSGSPVINRDGKVIGIVFATTKDDTYGNVGLFVPVDHLQDRLEELDF